MRFLLYARLSRDKANSTSIERQLADMRIHVDRVGGTIAGEAIDTNVSGRSVSPFKRPQLKPWLTTNLAAFDAILVWKLDRLTRSVRDVHALLDWAETNGKTLVSLRDNIDQSSAMGRAMVSIASTFAQLEAETTSERVRSYRAHRLTQPKWPAGLAPYGYRIVDAPDGVGKVLDTDPAEQAVFVRIAETLINGGSTEGVARELNAEGVPGKMGGRWQPTTVRNVTTSPASMGFKKAAGAVVRDAEGNPVRVGPPLVDEATWQRLQDAIERNRRHSPRRKNTVSMLVGVAKCIECFWRDDTALNGVASNGRYPPGYRCQRRTKVDRSIHPSADVLMSVADARVEEILLTHLGDFRATERVWRAGSDAARDVEVLETRLTQLRDDRAAGLYDDPEDQAWFRDAYARLRAELTEKRAEPVRKPGYVRVPTGDTYAALWAATTTTLERARLLTDWDIDVFISRNGVLMMTGMDTPDGLLMVEVTGDIAPGAPVEVSRRVMWVPDA